eukprot:CAMPEP_0174862194 /NCGR_PEP_ID=MMETSP1114-20130205/53511_1 /TAXON_ID=312471 /ORGANISM="Neobodo designis, Strain CCAP 1951/1" /LENGTH=253 /DNA_ID=CAMNT_0016097237 /DNA_START=90 /DNA_END=848 /DNA_ORIENTATION=+
MDALAGLMQQQSHHSDARDHALALHKAEMQHADELHAQEVALERRRFLEQETLAIDLQHAKLKHAVLLAERDAVRDALSHRSQVTQSIMLVNAVVLGCGYMLVYQVNLPAGQHPAVAIVYCATLGLSIATILLSIALALVLQQRIVVYDLHRPLHRYPCDRTHPNFSSYFECHCRRLEDWSLRTFYGGTVFALATAATLMYALLATKYHLEGVGVGTVVGIGFAALTVLLGDVVVPSHTHAGPEDLVGGGDYN